MKQERPRGRAVNQQPPKSVLARMAVNQRPMTQTLTVAGRRLQILLMDLKTVRKELTEQIMGQGTETSNTATRWTVTRTT